MIVPNTVGLVVIEALKTLKKPVPLKAIVTTVAAILEVPPQQVVDLVSETVRGGVHYGYIQESRERFAYFPINLSGLTDDDNLYNTEKKSSGSYRQTAQLTDSESKSRIMKRSASTCTYSRTKRHQSSPSIQNVLMEASSSKHSTLNKSKSIPATQTKLISKWRNEKRF